MRRPDLAATVERRLLVNYRADRHVVGRLLPAGLRPQLVDGAAVVGICLIRMSRLRPAGLPSWRGPTVEAVAHRVAVEWSDGDGRRHRGVHIWRRDTSSALAALAGGRLYPGVHGRARIDVDESADVVHVDLRGGDGLRVDVRAIAAPRLGGSLFAGVGEASDFFAAGSVGSSPARRGGLEAVELLTDAWAVQPVHVVHARSSFLDDTDRFPRGSLELDDALLMLDVPVRWRRVPRVEVEPCLA
jgi:hypothetical protein